MTFKIEGKQPKGTITKETEEGAVTTETHDIGGIELFSDPPCNVGLTAGITIPTYQYANVKASVSLHMPCKVDDINKTFDFVKAWVDNKLNALVDEIEESKNG